jgi:hypothetical protein
MRDFLTGVLCIFIPAALLYQILTGQSVKAALLLVSWPILVLVLVFLERGTHGKVPPR